MSENFLLAIDQGTTGTTALLVDRAGLIRAKSTQEFPQHFPHPGWVEHDLNEIWSSVLTSIEAVLTSSGVSAKDIIGIGITNQRETTCLWERKTLRPVMNAIVWQCKRSATICKELKPFEDKVRQKTGLVMDPYFSATKLKWMLEQNPTWRTQATRGELCFGTIDSFLATMLTGGDVHVTDVTNASRTLLFNIHELDWDDELLDLFDIPKAILPRVIECSEVFGRTQGVPLLPDGIPVCGILGDQQAALFGQACFDRGQAKCTFGTGAFMLVNIGSKPVASQSGLLTTVAWKHKGKAAYALEGAAFVAGAAVQWMRDKLGLIKTAAEIEDLAREVSDSGSVLFVPAFAGLGAPHWEPRAKASLLGLSRDTKAAHIARAVLEGVALQNRDILKAMEEDMGSPITELRVDGGASQNHLLIQYQSDVLGVPITMPQTVETTALGAAFAAGLALGVWKDLAAIKKTWKKQRTFLPEMSENDVRLHLKKWELGVKATMVMTQLEGG